MQSYSSTFPSTYTGSFDENYQRNEGVFELNYTYIKDGIAYKVEEEIKFWL
ncbi:hypothetical protein [Parabacteroides pacaensis]|uniref:hypothetical protein n=1 Tax=Parabacteroides pacaensis TaxID=2086575 RepID=UPI00131E19C9|nr:hypothetical protein [Parabacteroides pacaensis]